MPLIRRIPSSPFLDSIKLDLMDIAPCLDLRVSARARRLALRLDPKSGRIKLVVPQRASMKKALEFAREHRDWILKNAANQPSSPSLTDGSVLPVMGRDRTIRIVYSSTLKRTSIALTDDEITVSTNKDDATGRIIRFLKNLAREEITRIATEKATQANRSFKKIHIRDTSSRWGSCSEDGNLSFSWRLILAPPEALDYVVAHEIAHLAHMDHSKKFWAVCESLSADFATGKEWMKQNGSRLMQY